MDLEWRVAAQRAVVVVIDVQNDFCHPDGGEAARGADVHAAWTMLARLERFLTSARQAQIPIIFVQTIRSPDTESSAWRQRRGYPDTVICQPASWGAELCIRPADHDIIVEKHRYSAFASGGLVDQLTAIGRQSLLFTGVSTSICVESTLREAVCRDYYCTVISDCCAEYDDDLHEQALRRVQSSFGLVTTSESVADIWTQQHHTEPAS